MGEYGHGRPEDVHATLFATTMRELGLDARYGTYVDALPGITLTTGNLTTMFGPHRRRRSALVVLLHVLAISPVGPQLRFPHALQRPGSAEPTTLPHSSHAPPTQPHT